MLQSDSCKFFSTKSFNFVLPDETCNLIAALIKFMRRVKRYVYDDKKVDKKKPMFSYIVYRTSNDLISSTETG